MNTIEYIKWFYKEARFSLRSIRKWGRYPRTFVFDKENKLVYLNNPKVACSSIKKSIFGEHEDIHALPNVVNDLNPDMEGYYKFTFVRNPYERLVSCFEDKCIKHPDDFCWNTYLFSDFVKCDNFNQFVKRVCLIPYSLEEPHFSRQYQLIYDKKGKYLVDFVGKIENIKEEYEPIRKRFDLLPLSHEHRVASLTGKNWMDYYTPFTAWLVYRKYKKDFVAFGYEEEYKKLKAYLKSKNK